MERARQTADTAREQARHVGGEVREQTSRAVRQLRDRAREQSDAQSRRAAGNIRQWADDLSTMSDNAKPDSPMYGAVQQVATGGRRAADYLEERGVSGVLNDVQRFARRRPGLFLAGAVAAGFLAGRAAKATAEEKRDERRDQQEAYGQADTVDYGRLGTASTVPGTYSSTGTRPDTGTYGTSTERAPYGTSPEGTPYGTPSENPAGSRGPTPGQTGTSGQTGSRGPTPGQTGAPTGSTTGGTTGGTTSGPTGTTSYPAGGPSTGRPGDEPDRPAGEPR